MEMTKRGNTCNNWWRLLLKFAGDGGKEMLMFRIAICDDEKENL